MNITRVSFNTKNEVGVEHELVIRQVRKCLGIPCVQKYRNRTDAGIAAAFRRFAMTILKRRKRFCRALILPFAVHTQHIARIIPEKIRLNAHSPLHSSRNLHAASLSLIGKQADAIQQPAVRLNPQHE